MVVVRDVFQAKYGKGGDLVAHFKEAREEWSEHYADRIITDAAGPFFKVVVETEVESLAGWEDLASDIFGQPGFGEWFEQMTPLVESGQREFYNLET